MSGARTPEELEALLEDATVLRDEDALRELFEEGALVARNEEGEDRGRGAIVHRLASTWRGEAAYVATPSTIAQARDVAVMRSEHWTSVMRRGADGAWRYVVMLRSRAGSSTKDRSERMRKERT